MNFEALDEIVRKYAPAKLDICPICGCPFKPYHSRQKTCGAEDCMRIYHNQYCENRRRVKMAEDPEGYRAYRREAEKKTRRKKREREKMSRNYDVMETYWREQAEVKERMSVTEDGLNYGKHQAERILARVPKIDVSGFTKGKE